MEDIKGLDDVVEENTQRNYIQVVSDAGTVFDIPIKSIRLSKLLSSTLDLDPSTDKISLNIPSSHLEYIVEFMTHYEKQNPYVPTKPIVADNKRTVFRDEWVIEFMKKKSLPFIKDVLMSVNFMDMQTLLNILCAYVAFEIKNLSREQIMDIFEVDNLEN